MSDASRDRIAAIILHERFRDGRVVRDDFNVDLVVAQILREFAVLHRSEETIEESGILVSCGASVERFSASLNSDPRRLRALAANALAVADYIEEHPHREETPLATIQQHQVNVARGVLREAITEFAESVVGNDLPDIALKLADLNAAFDGYKHEVIKRQETALTKRRDELAREFYGAPRPGENAVPYGKVQRSTRLAIDRIIDLEDQLGARA